MRILRVVFAALLFVFAVDRGRADDPPPPSPEALAAATELFSILSADLLNQLTEQTTAMMWPLLEQRARADKIDDATIAELKVQFTHTQSQSLANILKDGPPVYARHFTVDELHQLADFYRSPVGVKAMKELPQVMAEFIGLINPRMQALQAEAAEGFNRILREHGYLK
jgi:uncharacterized protein